MSTPILREAAQRYIAAIDDPTYEWGKTKTMEAASQAVEDMRAALAALTQAADAGAAEPVATVEALQSRIAELEAELDDMEAERDEALRGPWPEWAKRMKTTIRKYSGYDGFDDASDGIDLPAELDDLIENAVEPSAQQLQQAVAREREKWTTIADRLLAHCGEGECPTCSEIICPHGDTMHFHHDGCPTCEQEAAAIRQQGTP